MYVPEKLKVNKFIDVKIPDNASYFSRLGEVQLPDSMYSGEESATLNQSKMDQIRDYEAYAEQMAKEAQSK